MTGHRQASLSLEELRELYDRRRSAIGSRLDEFSHVPPSEYFYELAYCLLTPQSSAVHAAEAVERLKERLFEASPLDPEPILRRKDCYIRFHKTKSRHLLAVKAQYPLIAAELSNGAAAEDLREWLVRNVRGLGWKEASHFLRNIGYRDLAILDRHILRNLVRVGVLRRLPATLTPRRYRLIEKKFRTFASAVGISLDELDLLFWSMETGEIRK